MDRLLPQYLTRQQLQAFLGNNPELIKAFETFVEALTTEIPDELEELRMTVALITALQDSLSNQAEQDRRETEAARMAAITAQVEQLREQIAGLADDNRADLLLGQLSQLREEFAAGGGMKRKRVVADSIGLSGGQLTNTYTIFPALASTLLADLTPMGADASAGSVVADAAVRLELTNTSTITATRQSGGSVVNVNFRLVEYTQ